jgi:hypothetical protein
MVTALRDRLADALRQNGDLCTRANADHLADVLLSLPGVVIVDLSVLQDEMRAAVESAITLVAAAGAASHHHQGAKT